jgi:hypothetical protein
MIYEPILPPWVAFYLRLPRPAKRALWALRIALTFAATILIGYLLIWELDQIINHGALSGIIDSWNCGPPRVYQLCF